MSIRVVVCIALVLGVQACGLLEPSGPSIEVRMDSSAYHRPDAHSMATVGFTVVNVSSRSAYLEGCIDPISVAFQRDSAGTWRDYLGYVCLDNLVYARLELGPYQTYHAAVRWDYPSRYRLRVYYGESPSSRYARTALGAPFDLQ